MVLLHYLDIPFPGYPVINAAIDVAAFFCASVLSQASATFL